MLFVVSNNLRFNGLSESEFRILMDLKNYRRRSTGRIFEVPVNRPVDRLVDRPRHNPNVDVYELGQEPIPIVVKLSSLLVQCVFTD